MDKFIESIHCSSRVHCKACRTSATWRKSTGAPEVCPFGVTTGDTNSWPLLLQPLKLLAKPEDKGLGDIVARVIGPVGGEAYKAWYSKTFGKPCGCTLRQDNLNQKYPLT